MDICQLNRGAHWHTPHMLSCSLVQTIGSSEFILEFFIEALAYQMCTIRCAYQKVKFIHEGHTLYQFYRYWMLWNEMDDFFFFTNE